jgi:ABC-2 type transport system ATP-binding protein/lipopolysaccharide transport system ATP-binding protein
MLSIIARDVHVEFPIYDSYGRSLRHTLGLGRIAHGINRFATRKLNVGGQIDKGHSGKVVIKALDGLSFDVHEGDRIGLLGHNGSGKTTLLRALAGIYEPVSGAIITSGRVSPLFDLRLGMDSDATGIENIWLRGKMLDLTTQQIEEALDDVAEFTELGDYLYMPIRTYSEGMMLRLAFAASTVITPEILILDEMIGAGDAAFLERADLRLKDFIAKTGILVIASHSLSTLRKWCNKGLVLEKGKMVGQGPLEDAIALYEQILAKGQSHA